MRHARTPLVVVAIASLTLLGMRPALAGPPAAQQPAASSPPTAAAPKAPAALPELNFKGVRLQDALQFLGDVSGLNIHVDWKSLALVNVTPDTVVTAHLHGVTLRKALTMLLADAAGGDVLSFYVDNGVVEISTVEQADKQLITRLYDVQDLLVDVPDFSNVPSFQLQTSQTQISTNGGGGGAGGGGNSGGGGNNNNSNGGLFGSGQGGGQQGGQNGQVVGQTKQERADALLTVIKETIRPDVWDDNGGPAHIRYFNGFLVVTAPRSVHEMLSGH